MKNDYDQAVTEIPVAVNINRVGDVAVQFDHQSFVEQNELIEDLDSGAVVNDSQLFGWWCFGEHIDGDCFNFVFLGQQVQGDNLVLYKPLVEELKNKAKIKSWSPKMSSTYIKFLRLNSLGISLHGHRLQCHLFLNQTVSKRVDSICHCASRSGSHPPWERIGWLGCLSGLLARRCDWVVMIAPYTTFSRWMV